MDKPTLPPEQMERIRAEAGRRLEMITEGRCPVCGAKVEQEKQIGRCVYGLPCGHRMYTGRASKKGA